MREAVGWLVYECEQYLTLAWDRDSGPPTLNGDIKASGLVLLKSEIIELKRFLPLQKIPERQINSPQTIVTEELPLKPKKRKTRTKKREMTK